MSRLDELVGNADVFPVLAERDYFNHAGVSPTPRPVADAVAGFFEHFQKHAIVGFDFPGPIERCGAPRRR